MHVKSDWRFGGARTCGVLFALAAACGAASHGNERSQLEPVRNAAGDGRTPLEKRRDAACEALAPKLTQCAAEDATADLAAGKVTQADFDRDTAPEILRKNTERFVVSCAAWRDISSRQVRVLEVCFKAEPNCAPLRDCLANLRPQ